MMNDSLQDRMDVLKPRRLRIDFLVHFVARRLFSLASVSNSKRWLTDALRELGACVSGLGKCSTVWAKWVRLLVDLAR